MIRKMRAVTAEREPTTVAKTWEQRLGVEQRLQCSIYGEQGRSWGRRGGLYPFPIAVFILLPCFVEVLCVEPDDCKGENKLQEAEDKVGDVGYGEARAAAVSYSHFVVTISVYWLGFAVREARLW